ncbi:MAG TPA: carboxypeptidase regulatory-like domain-containing protein, partial [Thermoanaerobaculia bacterium]|nr:carboxypeptidase regulatory-like domain-containing protein [Thermoanaerobaculia bacterium]
MKRLFTAAIAVLVVAGSARAQFKPTDSAKYPNLLQPVVLAQPPDLPDVAECRGLISQIVLDLVNNADEDPGEKFEKHRREHPHMLMMPAPLECASKLFKALKRGPRLTGNSVTVPDGTDLISLRQYPVDSVFNPRPLAASVGANIDPANGVEGYQGENNIAINPNNPQQIIAHSNTFYKDPNPNCQSPTGGAANTYGTMALFGSTNGGASWTYNCAPWPPSASGGVAGAAFWFGSDPALAWDSSGRAYACYMLISQNSAGTASGASIVVARSTDVGTTWSNLGTVVSGISLASGNGSGNDKQMMAIDNTTGQTFSHPGRIYVIWDNCSASACNLEKFAYSDDGAAWTTVSLPSNTGAIGGNVVVGADGTVYVIWNRYNVETIVFSKSTDGGATWSAAQVIATMALQSFGSNNLPPAQDQRGLNAFGSIDIDRNPASPFFGTLYVSFPDFPAGVTNGTDINTYVIRSTNGGTSWSSRVKVNDDNFTATQFFPWLAVDQSDGTVNVSWYDTRLDPLNRKTTMVYARSSNGGVSFEPNILITDNGANFRNNVNYADENSVDNTTYNGNQYGDYSGIAALNRQVHPLWTDSRMFFPAADTQSPTRREDNATSTIINCSAPAAVAAPGVNSTTAPSVVVSWNAPAGWGTNATGGTYSVYRATSAVFPGGSPLASNLTSTSYVDTTGTPGTTYFYFVRAKNNCPGTTLTPMTTDSAASTGVLFGSAGSAVGTLQGTVTSAGNPVSGATVTAGALSATTNAGGFYQFAAIGVGTYTVAASATGYNSASVPGVVVSSGATTVQNLSLTPTTSSTCLTDTTYNDFVTGSGTNVDIATSPGNVRLALIGSEALDQNSAPGTLNATNNITATTWIGQTFRAGATGNLTKITLAAGLATGGTSGTITLEVRNISGTQPGTTVLASATVGPITNVQSAVVYQATFATPAAVVSGTSYSIVLKANSGSPAFAVRGSSSSLANGQWFLTTTSGGAWTAQTQDLYFATYVTPTTLQSSGNFVSSVKDSGAVTGSSATWTTLSWTGVTPANTTLRFQAAASSSASGPFNFVGPD